MARVNTCGAETQDASEIVLSGTSSVQTSVKRSGAAALRCNPATGGTGYGQMSGLSATTGDIATFSLANTYARTYFRYATKPASSSEEILSVATSGGLLKIAIRVNSSGNLMAFDSTGTTQIGSTGSTVLASGTWYRVEVLCGTGTTASWEVRIDGTTEISGTGDLRATNAGVVWFGKRNNRNSQTVDFYYDDMAIDDATWCGAGAILLIAANGNGTYTSWTNDYTAMDEVPHNSDTDYTVSTGTSGDAESVTLQDCATVGITGTIKSVKAMVIVKRDTASNGVIRLRLRSGSTNSDTSANFFSVSAYQTVAKVFETDPATSAAWTLSGVDSAEVGVIERSTVATRCTALYASVEYDAATGGLLRQSGMNGGFIDFMSGGMG